MCFCRFEVEVVAVEKILSFGMHNLHRARILLPFNEVTSKTVANRAMVKQVLQTRPHRTWWRRKNLESLDEKRLNNPSLFPEMELNSLDSRSRENSHVSGRWHAGSSGQWASMVVGVYRSSLWILSINEGHKKNVKYSSFCIRHSRFHFLSEYDNVV